jgi:tetratricopeptide (TPR) repeat protein
LLAAAERRDDPEQLLEAYHALWPTLLAMGQAAAALRYIERGVALFDRARHAARSVLHSGHDPDVCCRYYLGLTRWLLGYPDAALDALEEALRLVELRPHPLTRVNALWFKAWVHHQRGEREASAAIAGDVIALSEKYGFTGWPDAALPLTRGDTGRPLDAPALADLTGRVVSAWTGGAVWRQVFCLCRLAEIHVEAGRFGAALGALRAIVPDARGAFYAPEIHRIEGEIVLRSTPSAADQAQAHFRTAIDLARARAERSLELRAATSLARLWLRHDRHDDARELLAGLVGWFDEGLGTADLRAARAVLAETS